MGSTPHAPRLWRPILASALGSLLTFVAVGAVLTWSANEAALADAKREAADKGELAARAALAPFLTPELLAGDLAARVPLDAVGAAVIATGQVVRLKVWTPDQRVVWSDDAALIGRTFVLGPDEVALFGGNGSVVAVSQSHRDDDEDETVAGFGPLLAVYFGTRTTSGDPVLVEAYVPYSLVDERADQLRSHFFPIVIGSFAAVALAQVPLALFLARRLRRAQRERERLLRVTTSNAERRRIAAEVHDGAVQDLIGVAYTLEAVSRSDDTTPLAELATSTRDIVTRLRALLNSIYPVEVPPEGWAHGFDDLAEQLRAEGVEVNIDITSMPLGPTDEILLLRVTREALRNVARHAQAHRVEIMFARTGRGARLEIDDDGRGFDPLGTAAPGHIGLRLLDDLARDLGAELEVDAAPGQGTTIRLDLMERR